MKARTLAKGIKATPWNSAVKSWNIYLEQRKSSLNTLGARLHMHNKTYGFIFIILHFTRNA